MLLLLVHLFSGQPVAATSARPEKFFQPFSVPGGGLTAFLLPVAGEAIGGIREPPGLQLPLRPSIFAFRSCPSLTPPRPKPPSAASDASPRYATVGHADPTLVIEQGEEWPSQSRLQSASAAAMAASVEAVGVVGCRAR